MTDREKMIEVASGWLFDMERDPDDEECAMLADRLIEAGFGRVVKNEVEAEWHWVCDSCGSSDWSSSVSRSQVDNLGCGSCGESDWHKEDIATGEVIND